MKLSEMSNRSLVSIAIIPLVTQWPLSYLFWKVIPPFDHQWWVIPCITTAFSYFMLSMIASMNAVQELIDRFYKP